MIGEPNGRALPERVLDGARSIIGSNQRVRLQTLGGMSGANVFRVSGPHKSLVAKGGVTVRERAVYEQLSDRLASHGIRVPQYYATIDEDGDVWLLLEDVPRPFPRERWLADDNIMSVLTRLHGLPIEELAVLPDRFQPAWTEAMQQVALGWLPDAGLDITLAVLRPEAAPLFAPRSIISGDPNPLNWGLSHDGELVRMDWERISLGHPALDVAITMPGLPSLVEFERTAMAYRSNGGFEISGRQLMLAKLWTVVELLASTSRWPVETAGDGPQQRRQETASLVASLVPAWLADVTQ